MPEGHPTHLSTYESAFEWTLFLISESGLQVLNADQPLGGSDGALTSGLTRLLKFVRRGAVFMPLVHPLKISRARNNERRRGTS
jgi:hypothetical protein